MKFQISIFELVSVAEETGLNLALSETPKTGFVTSRSIFTMRSDTKAEAQWYSCLENE